jgi:2-methylcitrate dehydratase PrpD
MGAQYSIPFCAAVALSGDPSDPAMYADAVVMDPMLRELAQRVELVPDEEMEAAYPKHYGSRVRLELSGGTVRESKVLDPHGMPADPVTESERIEKFMRLASHVLPQKNVDRILELVRTFEKEVSMDALSRAMAAS